MQAFIAYFDSTVVSHYIWNVHWHPKVTTGVSASSATFFSPWQKDGLDRLSPWVSVVEDLAPEVLILVCDRVCESGELDDSSLRFEHFHFHNGITHSYVWNLILEMSIVSVWIVPGVTRHEAQQWCLGHAFELVELNPQDLPDEDGKTALLTKKIVLW